MARFALPFVVFAKDLECFDILTTKLDPIVKETLGMVNIFVSPGRLKPILTQVCHLIGPLQIPLHKLDARCKPVRSLGKILMLLEVGSDTSMGEFEDLVV